MQQKKPTKSFLKMTNRERDAAVKEFDREISFDETRPLSAKGRLLWERAKRVESPSRGRGNTARVQVTLERELLNRADAWAKRNNLNRSQLIAHSIESLISRG